MSKLIQIVDENDQPIRGATKQEMWEKGLRHRIVRIMLEDGKGNILLQHRSPTKDTYPNCWDDSSAGHVDIGEDYLEAAYRELHEELGLKGVKLTEVGAYPDEHTWHGLHMRRFVKVYKATVSGTPKSHEPEKIDGTRWFSVREAKRLIKEHPDEVTDGLVKVLTRFY